MKGLDTFVANLANKINQPQHLKKELEKVFIAGVKQEHERAKELFQKILYLSNLDYCEGADELRASLVGINYLIKMLYPELEEKSV
jgi:hypothetical protein